MSASFVDDDPFQFELVTDPLDPAEPEFFHTETAGVPEPEYSPLDPKFVANSRKPSGAAGYEKKIRGLLKSAFNGTVSHTATVADAAAIFQYQDGIVEKGALLAVDNKNFARGIDFLTEGTENATIAFALAALPLVAQLLRNHEPVLEPAPRGFTIPIIKRKIKIPIKVGIKLGRLRDFTYEPKHMYGVVFNNPEVRATLEKQGTKVASF